MELEDMAKIFGFILAACGALALIFGIPSTLTSDPNFTLVAGGAISLVIGVFLFKTFG